MNEPNKPPTDAPLHGIVTGRECVPLMIGGLRKCIEAAFTYHDEFMDTFWCGWRDNGIWELHECYMASERTKIVVLREDGGFITNTISTDKFIAWVELVSSR
jgi:hypothetical protein